MSDLDNIIESFESVGGKFHVTQAKFLEKLKKIECFIFDWDGVFHDGKKGTGASGFFEPDSMGINMLRYGLYRKNNQIPFCAVITGLNNPVADKFVKREHFNSVYLGINNKKNALEHLCRMSKLKPDQICFVYDDINDLPITKICGLRIKVRRDSSILLSKYIQSHNLCDYSTAHKGGDFAIREVCELILGALGLFNETIESRVASSDLYLKYLHERNSIQRSSYRDSDI